MFEGLKCTVGTLVFKVTVHVGTDQNFEIQIFIEYEYALNELRF